MLGGVIILLYLLADWWDGYKRDECVVVATADRYSGTGTSLIQWNNKRKYFVSFKTFF